MAIENFEGKNIQDTFQRVVQTDGTNQLADGTGSIFIPVSSSHAITASHALFAVSASHEITFELSSSHAVSADTASFTTNFTSSGNISASGDGIFNNLDIDGNIKLDNNAVIYSEYTNRGRIDLYSSNVNGNLQVRLQGDSTKLDVKRNAGIDITGNVTASGNISASGIISASRFNGSGGDLIDVSYNNLSFVPSGIISGAAQINNLDLTINGGTF